MSMLFISLVLLFVASGCSDDLDEADADTYIDPDSMVGGSGVQLDSFEVTIPIYDSFSKLSEVADGASTDLLIYISGMETGERFTMKATLTKSDDKLIISSEGDNIGKFTRQKYIIHGATLEATSSSSSVATRSDESTTDWDEDLFDNAISVGLVVEPTSTMSGILLCTTLSSTSVVQGSGTDGDPYLITNSNGLEWIHEQLLVGNTLAGKKLHITSSIIMPDATEGWTPIGYNPSNKSMYYFSGELYGNNCKILFFDINTTNNYQALFYGLAGDSVVQDLTFLSTSVRGGNYVAILSAQGGSNNVSNITLDNCSVSGTSFVGALYACGYGVIDNCEVDATIIATGSYVGGMVAYATPELTISNSIFNGTVSATDSSQYVGGLIGLSYNAVTIDSSEVYGTIKGGAMVGGMIGISENDITIKDSNVGYYSGIYSDGNHIRIYGASGYVGGLIGFQTTSVSATSVNISISNSSLYSYDSDANEEAICVSDSASTMNYVGGMVGCADYGNYIDCDFESYARMNVKGSGMSIGGIIGQATNCKFDGCDFTNLSKVSATTCSQVGGIFGMCNFNQDNGSPSTTTLTNKGEVHGETYVGGCFGRIMISNSNGGSFDMLSRGYVEGTNYVGGIAGVTDPLFSTLVNDDSLEVSIDDDSVEVKGETYVGGCIGLLPLGTNNKGSETFTISSKVVALVSGTNYVGGYFGKVILGTESASHSISFSKTGDESNIEVSGSKFVGGFIGDIAAYQKAFLMIRTYDRLGAGKVICNDTNGIDIGGVVGRISAYVVNSASDSADDGNCDLSSLSNFYTSSDGIGGANLKSCYNQNTVTATGSKAQYIGGLVGRIHFRPVEFWGCCNIAAITGSGGAQTVGGLLGYGMGSVGTTKDNTEIYQSYNSGTIKGYQNIGGLIGAITGTLTVNNCYNSGTASSDNNNNCAGFVGHLADQDNSTVNYKFSKCYNSAYAGWGTFGNGENISSKEYSFSKIYYYSSSGGDDDFTDSPAESYTSTQMLSISPSTFDPSSSYWVDSSESNGLVYLKNAWYDSSKGADYPTM